MRSDKPLRRFQFPLHEVLHTNSAKSALSAKLSYIGTTVNIAISVPKCIGLRTLGACSFFLGAVPHIIKLRTEEKVIWAHAAPIVAFMAYIKTLFYWPIRQFVGNPVGHKPPARSMGAIAKNTVTVGIADALPFPTPVGYVNLFPETLLNRFVAAHLGSL